MKVRGFARLAAAAGAASVTVLFAIATAHAAPVIEGGGTLLLNLDAPTTAADFPLKGCAGIPGGAKLGTDGWAFDQPVEGADTIVYLLILRTSDDQLVEFAIIDGKLGELPLPDALKQQIDSSPSTQPSPDDENGPVDIHTLPTTAPRSGVAGGALTGSTGAWLQAPEGWTLIGGQLLHNGPQAHAALFSLTGVCLPATASTSGSESTSASASESASVSASASVEGSTLVSTSAPAGGTGGGLPVTGTNVWYIAGTGAALVAAGVLLLLLLRRRRDSVDLVA